MSTRFVPIQRDTPLLFPVDLRDWVEADDPVHFVISLANSLPSDAFQVNTRGSGSAQYPPSMMLALLLYCYSEGIFSSRAIEKATYRNVSVRYLTADTHPDHDTIATFRVRNREAIAQCFVRALVIAKESGLLKLGTVSVDGSVVRANASRHRNVRYEELDELNAYLQERVEKLLESAESADAIDDDSDRLPPSMRDPKELEAKLREAKERIEERERNRRENEQATVRRSAGKAPKSPEQRAVSRAKPVKPKPQASANLTDVDSRIMRESKGQFDQCYNAQAVADADGSQLILGARVADAGTDQFELKPDLECISEELGDFHTVLADCGFANVAQIEELEGRGKEVYVSVRADFISRGPGFPKPINTRPLSSLAKTEFGKRMREKLSTPEGKAIYQRRRQSIESCFGIIKHVLGFRQFHLRGLEKVDLEWNLIALAYNVKMIWQKLKPQKGVV